MFSYLVITERNKQNVYHVFKTEEDARAFISTVKLYCTAKLYKEITDDSTS